MNLKTQAFNSAQAKLIPVNFNRISNVNNRLNEHTLFENSPYFNLIKRADEQTIMIKTQQLKSYVFGLLSLSLFTFAIIFSGKSMADNMPLEQYVFLHKISQMEHKSTQLDANKTELNNSKFLLGGEDVKTSPILNKNTALKSEHLIDHHIFASPKKTKLAKRIAM